MDSEVDNTNSFTLRVSVRSLYVAALFGVSALLGIVYAVHNTDSHHWGFILGTALDVQRGGNLFSDIFIQYGVGQPLLLAALGVVLPLNYTSIGVFGALAYSATLALIFLSVERIASTKLAILVSMVAFLIHPYSVYPWPDYWAGLSLALAVYCLVRNPNGPVAVFIAVGAFLFAAFLFRNTYLVNITAAGCVFALAAVFNLRLFHKGLMIAISTFLLATIAYLAFLYVQGTFDLWYAQNFGAATQAYNVGASSLVRMIFNVLIPSSIAHFVFSLMLFFGGFFVLRAVIMRSSETSIDQSSDLTTPTMIFVTLLGATGFAQALVFYEMFRLQNASGALYVASAYWIATGLPEQSKLSSYLRADFALVIIIAMLAVGFPGLLAGKPLSTWQPIIPPPALQNLSRYQAVPEAPIFNGHRALPDVASYYSGLSRALCSRPGPIVNLTRDAVIPYLCGTSRNALPTPMFSIDWLSKTQPDEVRRLQRGEYRQGELVVAELIREQGTDLRAPGVIQNPAVVFRALGVWQRSPLIPWMAPVPVAVLEVQSAPTWGAKEPS